MSGMNPWLAEIYGTGADEDLEKTAQAHLLNKLAQEENIDLSQFSPEELQQLLQEVMGEQAPAELAAQGQQMAPQAPAPMAAPQAAPAVHPSVTQAFAAPTAQPQAPQGFNPQVAQQAAPQQDMASLQKEAQAKFEEADLLGRVMAHAYTQELEKIAAAKTAGVRDVAKSIGAKAKSVGETAALKGMYAADHVKKHKGAYGAAAATGAAGFAAGRASKGKEKGASAFEKLAEMHAADILSASGFDPATGTDLYAQQQETQAPAVEQNQVQTEQQAQNQAVDPSQASPEFAQALDQRALEMLEAAGYDVNEILARLQAGQGQA